MSKQFKIVFIPLILVITAALTAQAGSLSPGLQQVAEKYSYGHGTDSLIEVLVFLDDEELKQTTTRLKTASVLSRARRLKAMVKQLKSFQAPGKSQVASYISAGSGAVTAEYWIVPAVKARVVVSSLDRLSELDGVKLVVENALLTYEPPVSSVPALTTSVAGVSAELNLLGVTELWNRGLKGKGRLVCSFDTGVEHSHPALSTRWRGTHSSLSSSWFSKVAPDVLPYDSIGHGTHTMGIMVGAAEADSFGVAPEAEWITAGVVDQGRTLSMTLADIIEAFQWTLNPDGDDNTTHDVPDVILNSWGIPKGLFLPCDDTFWGMIDHVEAAGIVTIFSAGNEGPDPQTLRSPADRATTPINSFAVGAVDNNKIIAPFSSRGPSSCDNTKIKPEVVVPGVNIRSSYKGGGYYIQSGTSMAAPYVAGLVALVRQYNPDATVEEIKYAFLAAAEDLGPAGDDNAYGHGFLNASRVLDYVPTPVSEELEMVGYEVSGDGIAAPGELFQLRLVLNNNASGYDSLRGTITCAEETGVVVVNATADFYFDGGATMSANETPFEIWFDSNLYNGQPIPFELLLSSETADDFDTLGFTLVAGLEPAGEIATHDNGQIRLSVSDFGQFGFAPGSIYNVQGDGFCFENSGNILYEAGLILTSEDGRLVTSIRDEEGQLKSSDFSPVRQLTDGWIGPDDGVHRTASFADATGEVAVAILQETVHFDGDDDGGLLMVRYTLTNNSPQIISGLHLGFFSDFDLSETDVIRFDEARNLLYQTDEAGLYIGIVGLKNVSSFQSFDNGSTKTGFTDEQLLMATSGAGQVDEYLSGDLMTMITSTPIMMEQQKSTELAFALIAGRDLYQLYDNAARAKEKYSLVTSFDSNEGESLPDEVRLYQNYPNPFNPTTTISFSVIKAGHFSLDVVNLLGQKVTTLFTGHLTTGMHEFEWDATDDSGQRVASGVYFNRLNGATSSQSRKMLLIK
ncbi:MAG: S8 family serine peptidase [Candidatus Zixiibacteriota bacterium]|nr:MAG: S8 family serine peptidase [candidate division Zixibacteria bacterium]